MNPHLPQLAGEAAGGSLSALATSLFLIGLTGGFAHCIGMCGPFVMAQVSTRLEGVPAERMGEMHRIGGGLLAPYHLGRMTTYVLLGATVAALSGRVAERMATVWDIRWIAFALLVAAATFFAVQGMKGLGLPLPRFVGGGGTPEGGGTRILSRMTRPLFRKPTGLGGYLLGIMLGFLPCGLVYGALATAAATGNAVAGGIVMAAFTAGTLPALMVVGIAGQLAGTRMRAAMRRARPLFLFFSSGFLVYMAWRAVGAL